MTRRWLVTVVCWDGALPLIAALCPWLVKVCLPKSDFAELAAVLFVPMALALVRSAVAHRTLRLFFEPPLPWIRQAGIGLALVVLLFVDMALALKVLVPDAPVVLPALLGWLVYLGLIAASTCPPREEERNPAERTLARGSALPGAGSEAIPRNAAPRGTPVGIGPALPEADA
jgi:hypothetical protein